MPTKPTKLATVNAPVSTDVAAITRLLETAVEKGIPVETMERLVALHERMSDRAAAAEFAEGMAQFQNECPSIIKVGHTKQAGGITDGGGKFGFPFAPIEEIDRTVRPLLHKRGFSYAWDTLFRESQLHSVCELVHVNGHSRCSHFPIYEEQLHGASKSQKMGAGETYARRRTLIDVLGLTTCDPDTDAQLGSPEPITIEQVRQINRLIKESGADPPRYLKAMGVDTVEEIQQRNFDSAVAALEEKKRSPR